MVDEKKVEELCLSVYALRHSIDGQYVCGLPFVAMDDEAAKQMVRSSSDSLKDRKDLDYFDLIRVGLWLPDRYYPLRKKPVFTVCTVGELFAGVDDDGGNLNAEEDI